MNKLISILQPFTVKQTIFVYEDNMKTDAIQCDTNAFANEMVELSKKYNANSITLIGPKQYSKGIGKKILETEIDKYNGNTIEIIYK